MKFTTEFVLKLNEIYHDVEKSEYENKHPEIFEHEVIRWRKISKLFFANNNKKICLLDIGSGTGFVPLQIGEFLKRGDLLVCSDLSSKILNICKKNLSDKNFKCNIEYLKLKGMIINLESNVFDYITLNSVLHHIPDFLTFFKEINRLLKTNGRLIIGHEPNKTFYVHKILWNNYIFISRLCNPKKSIASILRRLKLQKIERKFYQSFNQEVNTHKKIVEDVNKRLIKNGIIKIPLTARQIAAIVDIHSPTAGGYHKDRGIDIAENLSYHLPNFKIEYLETYNHLCKVSTKNKFTKLYDFILRKTYPKTGATFFVVLNPTFAINFQNTL